MRCRSESKLEVTAVNETITKLEVTAVNETISYQGLYCISHDIAIQKLQRAVIGLVIGSWSQQMSRPYCPHMVSPHYTNAKRKVDFTEFIVTSLDGEGAVQLKLLYRLI